MNRLLFFKPGAIGDLLHTLPALKALRNRFPSVHVTVVVSPGLDSLLRGATFADRVLVFDKSKIKKRLKNLVDFGIQLRRERYDLFVDMQPSLRSLLLRKLSGAGAVLVYNKQRINPPSARRIHAVENFMETLMPLGISGPVESIELPVPPEALNSVQRFVRGGDADGDRPLIALNCSVGAARPARNWFTERFSGLADRIIDELHARVVFIGGNEDRDIVRHALDGMRNSALSVAGDLSIAESAALLSKCVCLVSSDTGPLHLATAVQTRAIGLFGSTDPQRTGPIGKGHQVIIKKDIPCVPCEDKECRFGTRACMAAITVEEVFDAVRKVIPWN